MNPTEDWRLFREQERYITGAHLIYHLYEPHNPSNDHDHCEFAWLNSEKAMPI